MKNLLLAALFGFSSPALAAASSDLAAIEERLVAATEPKVRREIAEQAQALSATLLKAREFEPAARALRYAGVALMGVEEHAPALAMFDRSAELCHKASDDACLGRALNNAGVALQGLDRMVDAVGRLRSASEAFRRAGDAELAGTTRLNMANIQLVLGDAKGALAAYEEIERSYPISNFELGLFTNKAAALLQLARFPEAERAASKALRIAEDPAAREGYLADMRIVNLLTLANSAARQGKRQKALDLVDQARARSSGSDRDEFNLAHGCLQVHDALNTIREAVACADRADKLRALEDEGTRSEALALAGQAFAQSSDASRGFALQKAAYDSVAAQRRAVLLQATAAATASVGLAERNARVAELSRAHEAERAASERWRLAVAGIIGAMVVLTIGAAFWLRGEQRRQREVTLMQERLRVARDLHDTALQGFAAVTMQLQGAARSAGNTDVSSLVQRLDLLATDASASLSQVRDAVWKVRSPEALSNGLSEAVSAWLRSRRDTSPSVVSSIEIADRKLSADKVEALLRVIQEAVTNAAHHGKAQRVEISATAIPEGISLAVVDDGIGFEPADTAAMGGRWGLMGMRERIEAFGGSLVIDSSPGAGTSVKAILPG